MLRGPEGRHRVNLALGAYGRGRARTQLGPQGNDVASQQAAPWRDGLGPGSVGQGVARKPTRRWTAKDEERLNAKAEAVSERPPRRAALYAVGYAKERRGTASRHRTREVSNGACAAPRAGRKRKRKQPAPKSPARRPRAPPAVRAASCRPRSYRQGPPGPRRFPCSAPPSAPASASPSRGPRPAPPPCPSAAAPWHRTALAPWWGQARSTALSPLSGI